MDTVTRRGPQCASLPVGPGRGLARDGARFGSAASCADTLGVNPGERCGAIDDVDRPGVWAFHRHILPRVEGTEGMAGTLIVTPTKADLTALLA